MWKADLVICTEKHSLLAVLYCICFVIHYADCDVLRKRCSKLEKAKQLWVDWKCTYIWSPKTTFLAECCNCIAIFAIVIRCCLSVFHLSVVCLSVTWVYCDKVDLLWLKSRMLQGQLRSKITVTVDTAWWFPVRLLLTPSSYSFWNTWCQFLMTLNCEGSRSSGVEVHSANRKSMVGLLSDGLWVQYHLSSFSRYLRWNSYDPHLRWF